MYIDTDTYIDTDIYDASVYNAKAQFALAKLAIVQSNEAMERARTELRQLSTQLTQEQCVQALTLSDSFLSRSEGADGARELSICFPGFPFAYYSRCGSNLCRVAVYVEPSSFFGYVSPDAECVYEVFINGREAQLYDGEFGDDDLNDQHPCYLQYLLKKSL